MKKRLTLLVIILLNVLNVFSQDLSGLWEIKKVKFYINNLRGKVTETTATHHKGWFRFNDDYTGTMDSPEFLTCGATEFKWRFPDQPYDEGCGMCYTIMSCDRYKMELSIPRCGNHRMDHAAWWQVELKRTLIYGR